MTQGKGNRHLGALIARQPESSEFKLPSNRQPDSRVVHDCGVNPRRRFICKPIETSYAIVA